jgi:potassium efflux system protein
VHLIVPNSRFIQETIVNRSYDRPLYRCRAPVSVDAGTDPRAAADALLEAARRTEGVLDDPAPSVRFRGFGSSSLNFELLCWTDKLLHRPGALISALNFAISDALERQGIRLPQTEIRVRGAGDLGGGDGAGRPGGPGTEAANERPREASR